MKEYPNTPVEGGAVSLDMCDNMKYVDDVRLEIN